MESSRPTRRSLWPISLLLSSAFLAAVLMFAGPAAGGPERPQAVATGGGEYVSQASDDLSDDERSAIEAMLAANVDRLARAGRLAAPAAAERVVLGWPLSARAGITDPGYHGVTGFVDHNGGYPGQLLDYACGRRTYDSSSGYNHQGTDYFLWPFAWNKMADGDVEVVAAADGVIVGRHEGYPDQSCSPNGNRWNAVYVRHADGSMAWYGHLKRGSVTPKGIGAVVARGEYLGQVGSSGNSTGPHLHFELYSGGQLTDPYAGSCNALPDGSWWAAQPEYHDSAINRLATGTAPVEWATCPAPDNPNEASLFQPGDRITFTAYYRDQTDTRPTLYRIVAPDGTIYAQWSQTITRPHYTLSYWWWAYDFPTWVQRGTWQFEAQFNGRTYRHAFTLGQPSPSTATPPPTPLPTATPRFLPDRFIFVPSVLQSP